MVGTGLVEKFCDKDDVDGVAAVVDSAAVDVLLLSSENAADIVAGCAVVVTE